MEPTDATLSRRAEAVCVFGLGRATPSPELVDAVAAATAVAIPVVLAGLDDAGAVLDPLGEAVEGPVCAADEERALVRGDDGTWHLVWERRNGDPFERWLLEDLWRRGVAPGSVVAASADPDEGVPPAIARRVAAGAPATGGDPVAAVVALLRDQSERRTHGELPCVDPAPGWGIVDDGEFPSGPARASLFALTNGTIGVIDSSVDGPGPRDAVILATGAYGNASDGMVRPLPGPGCSPPVRPPSPHRRVVDMHAGLVESRATDDSWRAVRFVSLARSGVLGERIEGPAGHGSSDPPLARPRVRDRQAAELTWRAGVHDRCEWAETVGDRAVVTAAVTRRLFAGRRVEDLTAVRTGAHSQRDEACEALLAAARAGYDHLLDEHRRIWARRWDGADIEIAGDPASQLAVRFALFHLLSCAPTEGEAAVGARGLTGFAYAGHVFWDTDVFVLPALAAVLPAAARAVIEYRLRRLAAARDAAAARGMPGARFAWESADSGRDVTPTSMRDVEGDLVAIRTGQHAEHINSDVAWGVHRYLEWTDDRALLDGDAGALVVETARYQHALIRTDPRGRGHIYGAIGPDEYHEVVDDNAYTNAMAAWHLRWAADLLRAKGEVDEAERFSTSAASLVDGFEPVTRRHEQFAGFWELEPLRIGDIAEPPVAADVLLGRARVRRTQIVKQPDVLMLHHLRPEDRPAGSLSADLAHYLPRTAHGSSLSPAICSALLARDGRPDEAMALFDLAARMDLDDLTGTTSGGLHLATMGGLWQAVVHGFAGIRPLAEGISVDPQLPRRWNQLRVRLAHRGRALRVTVDHSSVEVDADEPVPVRVGDRALTAPLRIEVPDTDGRS